MKKLIVTADVHGSHSSWLTLKSLLNKGDKLMVAGDLFDIRYGNYTNLDFQPDTIKKELKHFTHDFYYTYGNCDTQAYFPGYGSTLETMIFDKKIFMHHGHRLIKFSADMDIIIQGHTHLCSLEQQGNQIFLNPGSINCPRNGLYTYATIDTAGVKLIELKTNKTLLSIQF